MFAFPFMQYFMPVAAEAHTGQMLRHVLVSGCSWEKKRKEKNSHHSRSDESD